MNYRVITGVESVILEQTLLRGCVYLVRWSAAAARLL